MPGWRWRDRYVNWDVYLPVEKALIIQECHGCPFMVLHNSQMNQKGIQTQRAGSGSGGALLGWGGGGGSTPRRALLRRAVVHFSRNQLPPACTQAPAHWCTCIPWRDVGTVCKTPVTLKAGSRWETGHERQPFLSCSLLSIMFSPVLGVRVPFNLHTILVWITCFY